MGGWVGIASPLLYNGTQKVSRHWTVAIDKILHLFIDFLCLSKMTDEKQNPLIEKFVLFYGF